MPKFRTRAVFLPAHSEYHVLALPLPEKTLISRIAKLSRATTKSQRSKRALFNLRDLEHRKLSPRIGIARLIAGIGDDCAVLQPAAGTDLLVTTDFSLEGIHFRREWHPPESVGHRCLARGLSDIAAMGGEPSAAFLSLALPPKLPQDWVDRFLKGLLKLASKFGVVLAGGDTAQSPDGVLADIVVLGSVPKGKAVLRSGARTGDLIYVTGTLGESPAALRLLYSKQKIDTKKFPRHFNPIPRVRAAQILRSKGIPTAMIDLSDGLSTDLGHICQESGVGAKVWTKAIPRAEVGSRRELVSLDLGLHGGEDYELLFTAPTAKRVPKRVGGVRITCIGEITRKRQLFLVNENGSRSILEAKGWEHFQP